MNIHKLMISAFIFLIFSSVFTSCSDLNVESLGGKLNTPYCAQNPGLCSTITDKRDLNVYAVAKIGSQEWMAENLNYGTISPVSSQQKTGQKWCYDNNEAQCQKYGGLYQWANSVGLGDSALCNFQICGTNLFGTVDGLCPEGYRLPSAADWKVLANFLATKEQTASVTLKSLLEWVVPGSDEVGFFALPAGLYEYKSKAFVELKKSTYYLSLSEDDDLNIVSRALLDSSSRFIEYSMEKANGYSVRCIKK